MHLDLSCEYSCSQKRKIIFVSAALLFLCIITYGNSLIGEWIFDDEPNILLNKYVHIGTLEWEDLKKTFFGIDQKGISRPFAYLTFGLNYYFGQLDPFGYHVVNLLIHFCSSIFLFLFIHRTLNLPRLKAEYAPSSYAIALLATFFWASHPLHVTAVTYIVQRMASMAGMFYIMSMYFYITGRTIEARWQKAGFFLLCGISALLAFGTKENAVMLPVSIFLMDLFLIQGVSRTSLLKALKCIVLPAMIATSVILIFFVDVFSLLRLGDYAIRPFSMYERLLTEARVIVFYISLLIYPVSSRLMLDHYFDISTSLFDPWSTLAAILFILVSVGYSIASVKKRPLISYCIIFFFLNHLLEGSIIPLELLYEHRNYIPSMLFFLPFSIVIMNIMTYFSYRKTIQLSIAILIGFLLFSQGHTVYMYNYLFQDPHFLWSDNVEKAPKLSRPYNNLGVELARRGRYDEAYEWYLKAHKLNRYDHLLMTASPLENMGRLCFRKKEYEKAFSFFNKAHEIDPQDKTVWLMFVMTQIRLNELEDAEVNLRQSLARKPTNANFREQLSFVLLKKGLCQEALKEGWKTLTLDGQKIAVLRVIAEAYRRKGDYDRALLHWEQYAAKYRDLEGQLALIDLYSRTGQKEKLNKAIARVMLLKGAKSWNDLIDDYLKEAAAYAHVPDKQALLSIVRKNLLNDI